MGRVRIDREAFEVGFRGWDWSMGSMTRPLVCWVSSARSTDAREARFLVEFYSFPNTLDKFYHMYNVMRHIGKTLPLSSNEFLWIPVGSLECPIKMVMNFKRCEVWLLYSFVHSESGSQNLTT